MTAPAAVKLKVGEAEFSMIGTGAVVGREDACTGRSAFLRKACMILS
jgi:hypothetical protein